MRVLRLFDGKNNIVSFWVRCYSGLGSGVWLQQFFCMVESIISGLAFYIAVYLASELKLATTEIGLIVSCYGVGNLVGGTIGGKLCDYVSPNNALIFGLLMQALLFFSLSVFVSIHCLIFLVGLLGVAVYVFKTANTIIVLKLNAGRSHHEQRKSINVLYASSNAGMGVSALIIGYCAKVGFSEIFTLASCVLIMMALIQALFKKNKINIGDVDIDKKQSSVDKHIPNSKAYIVVLVVLFMVGLMIAQTRSTFPVFLYEHLGEIRLHYIGLIFAINPILIILFQAPLSNVIGEWNKMIVMGVGVLLSGVAFSVLGLSEVFMSALVTVALYTVGEILFFSCSQYVCYSSYPYAKKGLAIGFYESVYASSTVIGPYCSSLIYHYFGSHILWAICGGIGAVGCILCVCLRSKVCHL